MAGVKINEYGVGDTDLTALMSSADKQRRGFCGCSLTNYDNDSLPAIAEGSVVEVNGTLFEFTADESIGGSPSDGTVYIKIIPSGDTCTAEFDNDAPTWDDEKQGWYEAATNNRYLPFRMTKAAAVYSNKRHLLRKQELVDLYLSGSLKDVVGASVYGYMSDGTPLYAKTISITIANGLTTGNTAHGIALAKTNHLIFSAIPVARVIGGGDDTVSFDNWNVNNAIRYVYWNDTILYADRSGNTGALTVIVFLVYK